MNNLKKIRADANLSLRELSKYVSIRNATLSAIENGKQPFRQIHIDKLTSFFDVSGDYLLGSSDSGIGMYLGKDEEHRFISEIDYERNKMSNNIVFEIKDNDSNVESVVMKKICRTITISEEEAQIVDGYRQEIESELDTLDKKSLNKILKFIREYIK